MWVIKAAAPVQYSGNGTVVVSITDQNIKDNKKFEEISRMNISREEKIRLLKESEKEIVAGIAQEKFEAVSTYAEKSQEVKINIEQIGEPQGSVSWESLVGEPVIEQTVPQK